MVREEDMLGFDELILSRLSASAKSGYYVIRVQSICLLLLIERLAALVLAAMIYSEYNTMQLTTHNSLNTR